MADFAASTLPVRAFIVHCPGDPRRERNVRDLLEFYGQVGMVSVEVFDGIRPTDPGPFYSKGEHGSYMSHLTIIQDLADDPITAVMMIEDDTTPQCSVEEFRAILVRALAIESEWDTFHIGFSRHEQFRTWDPALRDAPHVRVKSLMFGMLCYMIHTKAMRPMAEYMKELAYRSPLEGGGIGWDGGLCMYTWEHPELVRLALVEPMVTQLHGVRSTHRASSASEIAKDRIRGIVAAGRRSLRKLVTRR
jgi:hypothetical protein